MKNITIQSCYINGFEKVHNNGVKHTKTLPYISIVQATEGYYSFGLDGGDVKDTCEGGFFVAPSLKQQEIIHHTNSQSKTMSARWIFLQVYIDDLIPFDRYFSLPIFLPKEYETKLNFIFDKLFAADNVIDRKIQCYECLKLLLPLCEKKNITNGYISHGIAYIQKNFSRRLSVEDIANEIGVSPSYLYVIFKREMDISPIAYLNDIKLSYACMLLEYTEKSVCAIAEECGICDQYYFSKLFKRKYGSSPLHYRKHLKQKQKQK